MTLLIDLETSLMRRTCRLLTVLMIAMLVVMPATLIAAPPTGDDAMDRSRLEKMLADGDDGMIVQVFRRYPSRTLPFIDQYFEGGLAMIEKGEDPAKAIAEFRKGIRFAEIADKAFPGSSFAEYANAFASWSPSEQKAFREGQKLFKKGKKETDPVQARKHLQRSQAIAESLGDGWGEVMAELALAELMLKGDDALGALAMANGISQKALSLRLMEDCAKSYRIAAAATMKSAQPTSSVAYASAAWGVVESDRDIDPKFREETLKEYLAILENSGMKAQADQLRKDQADKPAAEPAETAAP